jgi:prepilin peptidase CpaA
MLLDLLVLSIFPGAMAFAAASDLLTMKISNRLSLGLAMAFFPVAFLIGMPLADIGYHVAASALVLGVCFSFFTMGWIGGGDAKLAAATALWLGFAYLTQYLFLAAILGGLLTLSLLMLRRYPLPLSLVGTRWIERLHAPGTGVPYGIALAAAALLVYPKTQFIQAAIG